MRKPEICRNSEAFEVGPDCTGSVILGSILIESQEALEVEESIFVVVVMVEQEVNFIIISFAETG